MVQRSFTQSYPWGVTASETRHGGSQHLLHIPALFFLGFLLFILYFICLYFKDLIYLCLERGREGEREGEKHLCMIDALIGCL